MNHDVLSETATSLIIAEYSSLRDEILKRSEFRYQIVSLTLVVAGTIVTVGLQKDSSAAVLFLFPIIGCFLAGMWARNIVWTRRMTEYIRDRIESKVQVMGWETKIKNERHAVSAFLGVISGVAFLITEIIVLVLGLLKTEFSNIDIVLIASDVIAIVLTIVILLFVIKR